MPEYAYMPVPMSVIDTPTFAGDSRVPVIANTPDSLCTNKS